jgi:hypothetical protein
MLEELLPPPVLSIGLTGHRSVGMTGATAEATERGIGAVLEAAQAELGTAPEHIVGGLRPLFRHQT